MGAEMGADATRRGTSHFRERVANDASGFTVYRERPRWACGYSSKRFNAWRNENISWHGINVVSLPLSSASGLEFLPRTNLRHWDALHLIPYHWIKVRVHFFLGKLEFSFCHA
jgi:hypothetical protein